MQERALNSTYRGIYSPLIPKSNGSKPNIFCSKISSSHAVYCNWRVTLPHFNLGIVWPPGKKVKLENGAPNLHCFIVVSMNLGVDSLTTPLLVRPF